MKVQYASDIHLEFIQNSKFLQEHPMVVAGDILILAGDVSYLGDKRLNKNPWWDWAAENFEQTYIVPGNHEYYNGAELADALDDFVLEVRPNVHYMNNKSVRMGDIEIFLTTLWSPVPPRNQWEVEMGMVDCQRIIYHGKKFSAIHYNDVHAKCFSYLQKALANSAATRKIVVTHHVPTGLCNPTEYKNSPLNTAFVVELHDFIFDSAVDYWIYGHSHWNMPDTAIHKTELRCNQLGYVKYGEHANFRKDAFIEL